MKTNRRKHDRPTEPCFDRLGLKTARWAVCAVLFALLSAGAAGADWPRFRGPDGSGIALFADAPASWDGASGEGVLWKSPVPLPGENSPVVIGDRVFLAGAAGAAREVFCYNAHDGTLLWRSPAALPPNGAADAEYIAAPTMAVDGERAFAMFGDGGIVAFDFAGTQLWARHFGPLSNNYGHASSLQSYQGKVIAQIDQGYAADGLSALYALDGATGETAWKTLRPVNASWSSPILVDTPQGDQLILMAEPWVMSYDPADGRERWRAECIYGEVGPSPVYADGLVYSTQDGSDLCAIKSDGAGDVTETHIAWWAEKSLSDINSPLCDGRHLFLLTSTGELSCHDAGTGAELWTQILSGDFTASPSLSGDRLYVTNSAGATSIVRAAEAYEELGTAELGERVSASMTFAHGRIYMRGEKNLFCIGSK